jgi:site-specific DNA-methyltransferase (cytosine-N4-specific)
MVEGVEVTVAERLVDSLKRRTLDDPGYWNFSQNDKRSHGHALFPYPAMMVPQLQGALLDDLLAADPSVSSCYDPFAGSGTVMTEAMRRGMNFVGGDLNPLAVLLMSVKAHPLRAGTMQRSIDQVTASLARLAGDLSRPEFRGIDKWFEPAVARDLSGLRRAIQGVASRQERRFLWVCLAATVRLVCNSRTSTFKLHAYPADVLASRRVDTIEVFKRVSSQATHQLNEQRAELESAGLITRGRYTGKVTVSHANVLDDRDRIMADALMTSPPYGDNRTTVPYGQHSFLPLMWVDRADLPCRGELDELLGSPYRLDVASIGGRSPSDHSAALKQLKDRSPSVASTAATLGRLEGTGLDRFVAFTADLDAAIAAIGPRLRPSAMQFWTLGNRRISGVAIPTTAIVQELSQSRGASHVHTIKRSFPRNAKRMASRNDSVSLMDTEDILILRSNGS